MLDFRIDTRAADFLSLKWEGGCFRYGSSFIRPFDHPAIGCFALGEKDSGRFLFVVYERNFRGKDPVESLQALLLASREQIDAVKSAMLDWPMNVVMLEITWEKAALYSGACATCPVYVGASEAVLFGSWEPLSVFAALPRKTPDAEAIAQFLSLEAVYSTSTFCKGMYLLTERTVFDFDGKGVKIRRAENVAYIRPRIISDDADVPAAFDAVLQASAAQWLSPQYKSVGLELSGGLDSSCVALALRKVWNGDLYSLAILLDGEEGRQQADRRSFMIRKIGAVDHTVQGEGILPLSAPVKCWPSEEIYIEALDAQLQCAREAGIETVFTGIGGDELTKLSYTESMKIFGLPEQKLPPDDFSILTEAIKLQDQPNRYVEPTSVLPVSTLMAASARAPAFLRSGLWPAHPLASAEVYAFARSLPVEWRADRHVNRKHLEAGGMDKDFCYPRLRENFGNLFRKSIGNIAAACRSRIDQSALIDAKIVDYAKLSSVLEACDKGNTAAAQQALCFARLESLFTV